VDNSSTDLCNRHAEEYLAHRWSSWV
jgi:hypothetical protein